MLKKKANEEKIFDKKMSTPVRFELTPPKRQIDYDVIADIADLRLNHSAKVSNSWNILEP